MRVSMIVLVGITVALSLSAPAAADVRIGHDAGGQIGPYLERLVALRNSGERVIIDGPCLSACTMVLGVIPRERICMTGRARLGFHAAWHPAGNGQQVASYGGTQLLMQVPENLKLFFGTDIDVPMLSVTMVASAGGAGCAPIRLLPVSPTSGANAEI